MDNSNIFKYTTVILVLIIIALLVLGNKGSQAATQYTTSVNSTSSTTVQTTTTNPNPLFAHSSLLLNITNVSYAITPVNGKNTTFLVVTTYAKDNASNPVYNVHVQFEVNATYFNNGGSATNAYLGQCTTQYSGYCTLQYNASDWTGVITIIARGVYTSQYTTNALVSVSSKTVIIK